MKQQPQDPILMPMLMLIMATGEGMEGWDGGYGGRKKRSTDDEETAAGPNADTDADAWYGYYGYGLGHGYGGYYRPWGYGYWGRKKRSTDEPAESGPNPDLMPMLMHGMVTMAMAW